MASATSNSGPPTPAPSFRAHLKGITSSNDDPDQCALCHGCIHHLASSMVEGMQPCCGKRICSGCPSEVARRSVKACSCCGVVKNPNPKSLMGRLKKQAKAGAVWAQTYLGISFFQDTNVDSLGWLKKAAEGGHPAACYFLGRAFMEEGDHGTPLNYGRARKYLERAMALDDSSFLRCRNSLLGLAELHFNKGEIDASNSILLPLANSGFSPAQARIAFWVYQGEKVPLEAYPLFKSAVLGADNLTHISEAAYWAMICSGDLGRFAISKLLLPMASKCIFIENMSVEEKKTRLAVLVEMKKKLCTFRKECATCGTALDRSNRKLCKGCRNHCYCSRECQKVHWNRKKDGHRDECKEAQELKVQIRDAGLMKKLAKN